MTTRRSTGGDTVRVAGAELTGRSGSEELEVTGVTVFITGLVLTQTPPEDLVSSFKESPDFRKRKRYVNEALADLAQAVKPVRSRASEALRLLDG